ncbi:RCC1 domain-containing protein, partial [Bifidobacterium xylocopae]
TNPLLRGGVPASETVDGFTLSPTKGPANTAGTHTTITPPSPPTSGITFTQVSAGGAHSLAIGSDGNTYAWGFNINGQLGDGTSIGSNVPVRVRTPAGVRFTQVSAGYDHSLAIGDDGHAYSWGQDEYGQLGDGTRDYHPTPVRVTDPAPNTTWKTISAGHSYSLAIDNHGHAYSWGRNQVGQLGNGSYDRYSPYPYLTPARVIDPAPNTTWTAISAGDYHALAIDSDGHAYGWGSSSFGELGDGSSNTQSLTPVRVTDPAPNTTWKSVSAGEWHSLAIDGNGHAYGWGYNNWGQVGNGNTGTNQNTPARVIDPAPGTTWTTISAGHRHSLAIDNQGHAYSWGNNRFGQLGDNSNTDRNTPVPVDDLRRITVTGITLDRSDATPAPAWNTGSHTWDTTAPAHPDGQVTANIHWTLGGQPQPDYPLTYTYTYTHQYTLPKAGSIPIQRLSGGTLLLLTTLTTLTTTAHQLTRRNRHPARHIQPTA